MSLSTALAGNRAAQFAGFWIKLTQEEHLLTRYFPAEYPACRTRVKALIPFVL